MYGLQDASRQEIEGLIDSYILHQRNREIMRRKLIDGIRFEPLAEEFDLSVTQVKRIVNKGKQTILSHCW